MSKRGINVKLYLELYKRCPKDQLRQLRKIEAKHKTYVEKVNDLPAELPKIDWEHYRKLVRPDYVDMVNEFESKYTSFEVPMPEETVSKEIEEQRKEVEQMVKEYVAERGAKIEELKNEIEKLEKVIPFDQMTWEEYIDSYPNEAPNFIEKPTFWPHLPDEQKVGPNQADKTDH